MIKIENLVKTFGAKRAVDGISFTVERGEVVGFLGPNGAGKSTTMRMITGFYAPDSGTVSVGGHDVVESPLAAKAPHRLPAGERRRLRRHDGARLPRLRRRIARPARAPRSASARWRARSSAASSQSVLHQSIDTLSKGYRHRTCLAQALIHDPEVLDPGRAHRRPRSEPEARGAQPDPGARQEQGDHLFDPHPRGSRRGLHARHHHRPRPRSSPTARPTSWAGRWTKCSAASRFPTRVQRGHTVQ